MEKTTKNLKVRCPRCSVQVNWKDNPHRPFCSDKCQKVDLGRWASEEYSIAGNDADEQDMDNVIDFPERQ